MKLNGRKFGVEIEFYVPRNGYDMAPISWISQKLRNAGIPLVTENNYLSGAHHRRGDFRNWMLGTDSSLGDDYGQGLELATAPLKTDADVLLLKKALKVLRDAGCRVGTRCGLHVHHEIEINNFDVEKMIRYIVPLQPILHSILQRSRQGNQYCADWTASEARRKGERNSDRRKFVNFLPYYNNEPHIEFRAHHGSLKFAEIMNWVVITQRVVAVSQLNEWDRDPTIPFEIECLLGKPRSYNDLKRRLENDGHNFDDDTIVRHLQDAQKIEITGTTYYFLSETPQVKLARQLKLERPLARYLLGKSGMKKEFGDV